MIVDRTEPAEDRVAQVTACGRFRPNHYWQAPSSVLPGAAGMWRVAVLHQDKAFENLARIISGEVSVNDGWNLWTVGGTFEVTVSDGGGNRRDMNITPPSTLQGHTFLWGFSWDGSGGFAEIPNVGTGTVSAVSAGFTAPSNHLAIGDRSGGGAGTASEAFAVVALLGSDQTALADASALSTLLAEIEDNMKHGRRLDVGLSQAPENYYDARDIDFVAGEWPDHLGAGPALDQNGNPELLGVPGRVA